MAFNGGQVIAHVGADVKDYQSAMKVVDSSTSSAFGSAQKSIASVGKVLAVTGAAITAVGIKSLKGFGDFQQSLNQAAVIAGGTSKDIKGLSDVANEMGAVLPLSAQDAADAMVAMARDGASIETIKKEFPAIAQAATAAGADLQSTASVVQQAMNIWGKSLKSPQQAAAILTQTANLSNASIEDMQQALATIGGTASNAGIDMKTTASAIGLLTNRGFSAAQASQDLNHAILQMQAPSQIAQGQIDKLGLSFVDAQGNMKPLPQILDEIGDSMSDMTSSEKAAALKKMFGTSGMAAVLPLLDSVKDKTDNTTTSWGAFTKKMDGATDSTQTATKFLKEQADEMQKNLGSKIEQVGGNWEALSNKAMASSAGVTGAFLDMTNSALEWAGSSKSSVAGFIRSFIGLAPAIGAVTMAVGGFLTSATKIGSTMAGAAKFLVSPWGIALAGVMALAGGLAYAYTHVESFHKIVDSVGSSIMNVFSKVAGDAIGAFKGLIMGLEDDFSQIGSAIQNNLGNKLKAVDFAAFASKATMAVQNVIAFVGQLATAVTEMIVAFINTGVIQNAWVTVQSVIGAVNSVISTVIGMVGNLISSFNSVSTSGSIFITLGTSIGNIANIILKVISSVAEFISKALEIRVVNDAVQGIGIAIGTLIVSFMAVTKAVALFKTTIATLTTLTTVGRAIIGIATGSRAAGAALTFMSSTSKIAAGAQAALNAVMAINPWVLLVAGIAAVIAGLTWFVTQTKTGQAAWSAFTNFLQSAWAGMVSFFSGVWQGIISGLDIAIASIQTSWQNVVTYVQGIWTGIAGFFSGIWTSIITSFNTASTNMQAGWQSLVTFVTTIWSGISSFFSTLWINIVTIAQAAWQSIATFMQPIITEIMVLWTGFSTAINTIWVGIQTVAASAWELIKAAILGPALLIVDLVLGNWTQMMADSLMIWNSIKSGVSGIINGFISIALGLFNGFKSSVIGIWNVVKATAISIWNALKSGVVSIVKSFVNTAKSLFNGFKSAVSTIWNSLKSTSVSIWNGIKSTLTSIARSIVNGVKSSWSSLKGIASSIWNGVKSTATSIFRGMISAITSIGRSIVSGLRSAWSGLRSMVSSIWNGVKSAIHAAMNIDLGAAGRAIMNSFLGGLKSAWGAVKNFVGGIGSWIRKHKGPISYDRRLLIPAGQAIMGGFGKSLNVNFAAVQRDVVGYAGAIADQFNDQKYEANARLTASSSAVAGKINGGLEALDDDVKEQAAQSPVFEVYNEIVGDKITTTVNSKNARRQSMTQFMNGGM